MTRIVLFFSGIVLCIAGIVAVFITENWSIAPVVLFFFGVVSLTISLWLQGNDSQFWQFRSTRQDARAIAKTSLILIIIGIINWVSVSYDRRWDLTENKINSLSQQSQTIVSRLEQPLKVLVFTRDINSELENLLQNYRRYSQQFQFEFINPI